MKEVLAIVAAVLAIAGYVPYFQGMFKGRVKPHPYTWLVGTIVSGTVFFGMFAKGAGIGALPVAVSEVCTILVFLLSLKYGFKRITRFDSVCLALALLGLVPWALTKDATLSVVIAVAVDLISLVPTVRKTWSHPSTESSALYGANIIKHSLLLMSLRAYNLATTFHSIVMIAANVVVLAVIFRKRR